MPLLDTASLGKVCRIAALVYGKSDWSQRESFFCQSDFSWASEEKVNMSAKNTEKTNFIGHLLHHHPWLAKMNKSERSVCLVFAALMELQTSWGSFDPKYPRHPHHWLFPVQVKRYARLRISSGGQSISIAWAIQRWSLHCLGCLPSGMFSRVRMGV